jgi:hypothetical protein
MPQYKLPNIDDFAALYAQAGRDPRRFRARGGPDYGELKDLRKLEVALQNQTPETLEYIIGYANIVRYAQARIRGEEWFMLRDATAEEREECSGGPWWAEAIVDLGGIELVRAVIGDPDDADVEAT